MEGIRIEVVGNVARVIEKPSRITSGTVGLPVEFSFDSQWDGLGKTAVFRAGFERKVINDVGSGAIVPWEVLKQAGVWLSVGVYGSTKDGTMVIPTIWANVAPIQIGVDPEGEEGKDPSPSLWQDILDAIGNLQNLKTTTKENLVAAINEVYARAISGGGGGGGGEGGGSEGFSPTIDVTEIDGGHVITITDVFGTEVMYVMDGVSPTIKVNDITGGHAMNITDKNGTQMVYVMDGAKGDPGDPGYSPVRGVDYFTEDDQESIVEEVLKQMPEASESIEAVLSGKWTLGAVNYNEPMGTVEQAVKFKTTLAIYDDGNGNLLTTGSEENIVSYHSAVCNKMSLVLDEGMAAVTYTVESTDAELQAVLDAQGGNDVPVYLSMAVVLGGKWFPKQAKYIDFGAAQVVSREFAEAFKTVATIYYGGSDGDGAELVSVSVTEAADGTVTMVNTLDSGTETIVIGADANGNPNKLTYNGKEIPVEWAVS